MWQVMTFTTAQLASSLSAQRRFRLPRIVALLGSSLLLAGCATGERDLMLQGDARDIAVVVDAAAAPPAEALSGTVARTSTSFITLLVKRPRKDNAPGSFGRARGVATGSGFFIDTRGKALTAGHVAVEPGLKVSARAADGRIHEGRVIAVSSVPDIGMLQLRDVRTTPVTPAASPCLSPGTPVFSLGRPRKGRDTARIGTLQSLRFTTPVRYGNFGYDEAMVVRMSTRRGESGGPLFNQKGELVGMIVSTLSRGGRSLNLAHAIPLTALARFVCANGQCSARWRKLAGMSTRNCPTTTALAQPQLQPQPAQ